MAAIQPKPTSSRLTSLLEKLPHLEFYTSSPSIPLLTFKPFPRLPRELRNIICGMIASEPRVVKVIDAVAVQIWKSAVEGQSRQPAVMHVNQESRSEGARFYTLCREKTCREVCRNEQWRKLRTWSRLREGNLVHINFETDEFLLVPFDRTWVYWRRSNVNCMSKKLAADRYNFGVELLEKIMRMAFENGSVRDWILDLSPVMNCHEYILRKSWNFDEKSTPLEEDIRKRYLARQSLVLLEENMTWHVTSKIPCKNLQIKLQWM